MGFSQQMDIGHQLLGAGNFGTSITQFRHAVDTASTDIEWAQAQQMLGIALRLKGQILDSIKALEAAHSTAGCTSVLAGQVMRDLAMSFVTQAYLTRDTGLYSRAATLLQTSIATLSEHKQFTEVGKSEGFMGRLYLMMGKKSAAAKTLRHVHSRLTGQDAIGELNNLMWLARASIVDRWRYARRAFVLIGETGHARRRREYAILLLGGDYLAKALRW